MSLPRRPLQTKTVFARRRRAIIQAVAQAYGVSYYTAWVEIIRHMNASYLTSASVIASELDAAAVSTPQAE